ncbi:MAG: hypothetical protein ACREAU_10760 [Nitrosopumilaceae archaeon]
MKKKNLVGFFKLYLKVYENLNEYKAAAWFWFSNFMLLFSLPLIWSLAWVALTLSDKFGGKDESPK